MFWELVIIRIDKHNKRLQSIPAVAYVLRQNCYVLVIIERLDEKSLDVLDLPIAPMLFPT